DGKQAFKLSIMPDDTRVKRSRTFEQVGLDYMGPISIKTYIGRGCPKLILSDNATQFHAVFKTLKDQVNRVTEFLSERGIIWKNIILRAPWAGGVYERIIGLTKEALKKAIDIFWEKCKYEYLTSLRERTQRGHRSPRSTEKRTPHEEEIVLVNEPETPRSMWKLAKIKKINRSKDGEVRSAQIQMPNGKLLDRSINLLYPLEITNGEEKDKKEEANLDKEESRSQSLAVEKPVKEDKQEEPIARRTRSATKRLNPPNVFNCIWKAILLIAVVFILPVNAKIGEDCKWISDVPFNVPKARNCEDILEQHVLPSRVASPIKRLLPRHPPLSVWN
ncbi:unnamed protein product, partial [Onchocerca ochengi]